MSVIATDLIPPHSPSPLLPCCSLGELCYYDTKKKLLLLFWVCWGFFDWRSVWAQRSEESLSQPVKFQGSHIWAVLPFRERHTNISADEQHPLWSDCVFNSGHRYMVSSITAGTKAYTVYQCSFFNSLKKVTERVSLANVTLTAVIKCVAIFWNYVRVKSRQMESLCELRKM